MIQALVYDLQERYHRELDDIHQLPYNKESRERVRKALENYHRELVKLLNDSVCEVDRHYK